MQIFYFSPFLQDLFPSDLLAGQERKGTMQGLNYLVQQIQRDLLFSCTDCPMDGGHFRGGVLLQTDLFPTLFFGSS